MGIVQKIAFSILLLSFAVFVAFFGRLPVFRRTPIGFLHRLIWIHIPNGSAAVDQYVTGGRLGSSLKRTGQYLLYEKHPIVLIFFLALLLISEVLFLPPSLPLLPITFSHSTPLLILQYILLPLLITPPYLFLHLSHSTPSTITPTNHHAAMHAYPYDHTIFPQCPGPLTTPCRTCHLPKPARSKHCSICRSCIQKADHHCVWINNCVGRNNYLYFLGLMLSTSFLLAYGAWLGYRILYMQIGLHSHHPTNGAWSQRLSWRLYTTHFADVISVHPFIAAPALLAGLSFPLAAGLSLYHVYLIWAGMTTNESGKWADLREDIAEGLVWRALVEELGGEFLGLDENRGRDTGTGENGEEEEAKWPIKARWVVVTMEEPGRRPRIRRRTKSSTTRVRETLGEDGAHQNGDAGFAPGDSEQWYEDLRWTQVHSLAEIENIYDLGFWDNVRDILLNRE